MGMEAGPEEVSRAVSLCACAILETLETQESLLSSATCPGELSYSRLQLISVGQCAGGHCCIKSHVCECPAHVHFLLSQMSFPPIRLLCAVHNGP